MIALCCSRWTVTVLLCCLSAYCQVSAAVRAAVLCSTAPVPCTGRVSQVDVYVWQDPQGVYVWQDAQHEGAPDFADVLPLAVPLPAGAVRM